MIGRFALLTVAGFAVLVIVLSLRGGEGESGGESLADVSVPRLSAEQKQGESLFNASCASCHGINAAGKDGLAPPLVHKIYEPSHHGDMAFVLAAKQGVRQHHWQFGNMPPQPDVTDEQIQLIVAYVRALQRANGID